MEPGGSPTSPTSPKSPSFPNKRSSSVTEIGASSLMKSSMSLGGPAQGTHGSPNSPTSSLQLQAFRAFWPWLEHALQTSSLLPPVADLPSLCIANYGCATGRNAAEQFGMMRAALEQSGALQGDRAARQLQMVLNDLPSNDWNAVVKAFSDHAELVLLLSPRSFHSGTVAALDSVHFGVCTDALCWLSQAPHAAVPDHVTYVHQGEEARAPFRRQAESDFHRFLRYRALELVPGGLLLIVTPGTMESRCCAEALLDCLHDAARLRASKGQLDAHLLRDFAFPTYYFGAEELEQLAVREGQWEVLQLGSTALSHMLDAYRASGDAAAYARNLCSSLRAFSERVVRNALALDQEGTDALYATAERLVAAQPDKYVFRNIQAAVLLKRLANRRASIDESHLRNKHARS